MASGPSRATAPVFPSPPQSYDPREQAAFRREVERFMQAIAETVIDLSSLPPHANTHHSGGGDEVDHGSIIGLGDDDHTQYHTDARALTWLGTRSTTDLPEGSNLYFTAERVDDQVATLITNSATITWSYNDVAGTLTGSVVVGAVDHGSLAGLGDDDHTQYLLASGARNITGEIKSTSGGFFVDAEGAAFTIDASGSRRFGLVKEFGFSPEIRYLSTTGIKVRRVTTGTIKAPSASGVVMEFQSDGQVAFSTQTIFNALATLNSGAALGSNTVTVNSNQPTISVGGTGQIRFGNNNTYGQIIGTNSSGTVGWQILEAGQMYIQSGTARDILLRPAGTTALTLYDTSLLADFAGSVNIGGASLVVGSVSAAGDRTLVIDSFGGTNDDSILEFKENTTSRAHVMWDGVLNELWVKTSTGDVVLNPTGRVKLEDGSALQADVAGVTVQAGAPTTEDYPEGTIWLDTSAPAVIDLEDLGNVTITSVADNEVLQYDSVSGDWINQTLAEAGISAVGHTHAAADVTSGTFADARIAASNVTQHQAALTIAESQITDGSILARLAAGETVTGAWTFDNVARVTIDDGSALTAKVAQVTVQSGTPTTEDYPEGTIWLDTSAAAATALSDLSDTSITSPVSGALLMWDGADWIDATTLDATSYTFAPPSGTAASVTIQSTGTNVSAQLVIQSSGGTGTPMLRFRGRALAAFDFDDSADMVYSFYSTFSSSRTNDAEIRIHGSAASSWNTYLGLKHDGSDALISTDVGDIHLTPAAAANVKITDGALEFTETPASQQEIIRMLDVDGHAHVFEAGAADAGEGIALRALTNPVSGAAIWEVRSSGNAERWRVEHDGAVGTDNPKFRLGSATTDASAIVFNLNGNNLEIIPTGGGTNKYIIPHGAIHCDSDADGRLVLPVGADQWAT